MSSNRFVAEQTSRSRYSPPAPSLPQEIELTVRLEIPEVTGADVSIRPEFASPLPPTWQDAVYQRLYAGVHDGLARVGAPLPAGGIGVVISGIRVVPLADERKDAAELLLLGDTLETLTASTVSTLWAGMISRGAPSAA